MRIAAIWIVACLTTVSAIPFNPYTSTTLDAKTAYAGASFAIRYPLDTSQTISFYPTLRAGYGIIPRLDASVRVESSILQDRLYPVNKATLKGRFMLLNQENFTFTPALNVHYSHEIAADQHFAGVGPEVSASANLASYIALHASLEYAILLSSENWGQAIWAFLTPQLWLGDQFSIFVDIQFPNETKPLYRPGFQVFPTEWLSFDAGLVVPSALLTDMNYLTPGIAAYVSF